MTRNRFKKGDVVSFLYGTRTIQGMVREDRGPIGIGGRRLYAVEFRLAAPSDDLLVVELPADDLRHAKRAAAAN